VAAVVQPYKDKRHFKIDMLLFLALSMWVTSSVLMIIYTVGDRFDFSLHLAVLVLSVLIQFAYFTGLMLYWLLVVKKWHRKILHCLTMYLEQQNYYPLN